MNLDRSHDPLPVLLVCMTVVTGLVDAFSYLSLGHVFVANMTGNVVFLGFALARLAANATLEPLRARHGQLELGAKRRHPRSRRRATMRRSLFPVKRTAGAPQRM